MNLAPKRKLLVVGFFLLLIGIGTALTVFFLQQPQDTRTKAAGGTSLSLIPQPGPESSIEKNVGETVPIDLKVDPGSNSVTTIRLQIKYDPLKIEPVAANVFTATPQFPAILEGPIVNTGTVSLVLSVGADTTKAIRTPTKVGTFTFKTLVKTPEGSPTIVSFTNLTQAYSSGSNDQAAENILANTNPASITILDAVIPPTPTLSPAGTTLFFTVLLHGIGSAGDTPNPTGNSLSNKNPRNPQRNLVVGIFDANDQLVKNATGTLTFDNEDGIFQGTVSLGDTFSTGTYTVKIKSDRYLRKAFPGVITITRGQENPMQQIELVAGDTDNDNTLNVLDYNALLDCGYGSLGALPITNANAEYSSLTCKTHEPRINIDVDDNGFVNAFDYNLFIRELSVQSGD